MLGHQDECRVDDRRKAEPDADPLREGGLAGSRPTNETSAGSLTTRPSAPQRQCGIMSSSFTVHMRAFSLESDLPCLDLRHPLSYLPDTLNRVPRDENHPRGRLGLLRQIRAAGSVHLTDLTPLETLYQRTSACWQEACSRAWDKPTSGCRRRLRGRHHRGLHRVRHGATGRPKPGGFLSRAVGNKQIARLQRFYERFGDRTILICRRQASDSASSSRAHRGSRSGALLIDGTAALVTANVFTRLGYHYAETG